MSTVMPEEHARGFSAQYASVFSTLTAYLEIRTSDAGDAALRGLERLLREFGPIPTYSEYRMRHAMGIGLPDTSTRERVLLDGAVRGLNVRVASELLYSDEAEANALRTYTNALIAFIRGEGEFPGFLDVPKAVQS